MVQVCSPFYRLALGVSKARYLRLRYQTPNGRVLLAKLPRKAPSNIKIRTLHGFLQEQFKLFGQYVPNKDELHLPSTKNKSEIFATFVKRHPAWQCMKLASFCRAWIRDFPRVKILPSSDFAKCKQCIAATQTIDAVGSSENRGNIPIYNLHITDSSYINYVRLRFMCLPQLAGFLR